MPVHVFLSHSSTDKPAVEELARRLAKEGIQAWLDKWHLIPGDPWQPALEKALAESESSMLGCRSPLGIHYRLPEDLLST
jgi:hypothetical protein